MFEFFIRRSLRKANAYKEELDRQQEQLKKSLEKEKMEFDEIYSRTQSEDPDVRFQASIDMARFCGVPEDQIIHNEEELEKYFTE